MNNNLNELSKQNARNIGSYTREAVKAFQEGIVNEDNFIEKVQDNFTD